MKNSVCAPQHRTPKGWIHPGGEATRVLAQDGSVLLDDPDDGTGGRPEVPRGALRRMLPPPNTQ